MKVILTNFLLFLPILCFTQNLVPNPSFENYTECPNSKYDLGFLEDWFNAALLTPNFHHSCATEISVDLPENSQGSQETFSGEGYLGLYASQLGSDVNVREYLTVELAEPLEEGITYTVSFRINLSDYSKTAAKQIGAYFSTSNSMSLIGYMINAEPQVTNNELDSLIQKEEWMLIEGTYVPEIGGERFLTLGNFLDDEPENLIELDEGLIDNAYYYYDEISVVAQTVSTNSITPIEHIVFPNPANNSLTLSIGNPFQACDFRLFNVDNIEVLSLTEIRESILKIDCVDLPSGIYYYNLSNTEGELGIGKIVIEH